MVKVNYDEGVLVATNTLQTPKCPLRALVFRTLLLLLYGTGMRIGEALSLTMHDVDLTNALIRKHIKADWILLYIERCPARNEPAKNRFDRSLILRRRALALLRRSSQDRDRRPCTLRRID